MVPPNHVGPIITLICTNLAITKTSNKLTYRARLDWLNFELTQNSLCKWI